MYYEKCCIGTTQKTSQGNKTGNCINAHGIIVDALKLIKTYQTGKIFYCCF